MDKVLKFLKNRWFLLGISFLSFIYVYFLGKIAILVFTCYLEISNFASMMVLYVFINFIFGVLMFFTRKQIPTILSALIVPLETLFIMIAGFGEWYLIIPPVVVSAFVFLSCGAAESFKTVAGTLLLLMFIVGGLVYSVFLNFDISLNYVVTDRVFDYSGMPYDYSQRDFDYSKRKPDYLENSTGEYRVVTYVTEGDEYDVVSYYVEEAFKDEELPFVTFRRVFGCKRVLTTAYANANVTPKWISEDTLTLDGVTFKMEELFAPLIDEEEEEETTTSITRHTLKTEPVPEETSEPEESTAQTDSE